MRELEVLIGLILAATLLAAVARRVGAPYPTPGWLETHAVARRTSSEH
jgi:hypothetical protein